MKLWLKGNDYKYAAEQIMLMMFPEQRPEYPETAYPSADDDMYAVLSVKKGAKWATATAKLKVDGREAVGISRGEVCEITDKMSEDRLLQKIMKMAFYKAAVERTGKTSVWGSLTGIRPGKIVTKLLEEGATEAQARNYMVSQYRTTKQRAELCIDTAQAGIAVKNALDERDIALYIGIPFCPTRCAYCSFVSLGVEKSLRLIQPFLDTLYKEIDAAAETVKSLGLNIISVYMGGGTPTTLSAEQMDGLLSKLKSSFDLSNVRDYTVEAGRPDTITAEKMAVLHKHGVERISINPQTMSDDVLRTIGRRHTAQEIVDAYKLAREAGIRQINMDLIAGLPNDTAEGFRKTLDAVMALDPENITVHTLSLKKGSKIMLEGTAIPTAEEVGEMLDYAADKLRVGGFAPYYLYRQKFMSGGFENVGWAKRGCENLYNICIMEEFCSIIALGGGGSTKLVAPKTGKIKRVFNAKYPQEYIEHLEKSVNSKEEIVKFYEEEVF